MKKIVLFSSLLLCTITTCNAIDNNIFKYRQTATNSIGPGSSTDISAIQFDASFFDKTTNISSDLRIATPDGLDIPFVVKQSMVAKKITHWNRVSSKIIALKKAGKSIILEVKQNIERNQWPASISRLKIITLNQNFEKKITIFGSNDRKKWHQITSQQPFFDYTDIVNLRNNTISFPTAKYRFFKIVINNYLEERESPLYQLTREKRQGKAYSTIKKMLNRSQGIKITAIKLEKKLTAMVNEKSAKQDYTIKLTSIEQHNKTTEIIVKTQRQPLTSFKLKSNSKNFSRQLTVAYQDEKKRWHNFATGVFEQIAVKGFQSTKTTISFPEARHSIYKITIDNRDNRPLNELNITATGNIYQAMMLGTPEALIYLFYGSVATMPSYDINTPLARITSPTLGIYQLSNEILNPNYQAAPEKNNYKIIFICLISLTALILAVILFKNFGKLDATDDD